ncbi:MAG TPA: hydroxymethylbilane synthase [Chthonomonadaceae bacterium]|nr:hydroxymethylbilane synthase [Chthonomonadaceae bacterium]
MGAGSNEKTGAAGRIRIGTRGSLLSRTQTDWAAELIRRANPGLTIEIQVIQTTGDLSRDIPFAAVGTKGMFVKEIEQALLDGAIDVGVHSLKDMPSELPAGLELACVPPREDPLDALLARESTPLDRLAQGAVVGTSSTRRAAQLRAYRPDLRIQELRGNLDTRIRKLDDSRYDAILLAAAGLRRLGWAERITELIAPSVCVPAAGQGALALETRTGDATTLALLQPVHDADAADAVAAERAFLRALGGGCSVPAGAYAALHGGDVRLLAMIAAPDGSRVVRAEETGPRSDAAALGARVADRLLREGGREMLQG